MNFLSVKQAAKKWGITPRRVQVLCEQGRIDGAQRVGNVWTIPEIAMKPEDARRKIQEPPRKINTDIAIERVWAMPNKNTFEIKPIHELILDELTDGLWIDPFANRNKLATVTNDLSLEFDTDYHLDALDFMKLFENDSVEGVLYDPPYSPRQVSECYNNVGYDVTWDTTKASFWGNHKREISRIVKLGGKVITFGWNSGGIGYKYGFEIQRILLVPHGGWHNDTICTVEIKTHEPKIQKERKKADLMNTTVKGVVTENDRKLIEELKKLPDKPGVYIMHSDTDEIIYVGKAINLKNRVRQYFQNSKNKSPKVAAMVSHIAYFEYIVTASEMEALLLECNLIKEHRPKYNVMLKDDKTYPYIKVTTAEEYPRIFITRKYVKDKNRRCEL